MMGRVLRPAFCVTKRLRFAVNESRLALQSSVYTVPGPLKPAPRDARLLAMSP